MEAIVREIEEKDYAEVAELFVKEILGGNENGEDYYGYMALFFNKVKNDERYKTFTALLNDKVAGFISTAKMTWIMSEILFVQCIAVKSEFQNKGVGAKLLKHAEDYANVNGMTGTGLQSGVRRADAHAFYEHNGYTRSNYFYKNFK